MPSRTRAWTRSTIASSTSSWATWPHQVSTSVAARTASVRPCSGSSSVAVRTSKPPARAGRRRSRRGSRPGRSPATGGSRALLAVLVPDGDADRHAARSPRGAPGDHGATALGRRFADRVPQAGHPEADLGRARVRLAAARGRSGIAPRRCVDGDGPDRAQRRGAPDRWSSRRSPQIPVRSDGRVRRTPGCPSRTTGSPDRSAFIVTRAPDAEAGHDDAPDVDRAGRRPRARRRPR